MTSIATDISESTVEVIPSSEVTHMITNKSEDVKATFKMDTVHAVISGLQEAQEKESLLQAQDKPKISIKPSLIEVEPLLVTEAEITIPVDDYHIDKINVVKKVDKSIVLTESLITTETETNISLADLDKDENHSDNAKPGVILTDALNVSEQFPSLDEQPLVTPSLKSSNAAITFSPLVGISVLEISSDLKEGEIIDHKTEKEATSKVYFNLHESLQVGEVFVEDKSGKYYPELIVPTESARKNVLVSNQIVTEIHNVQESEGSLTNLKLPPFQEAHVDFTSKDSIMVSIDELHEKEGELTLNEIPVEVTPNKGVVVHSSLSNTVTATHIKESEFSPEGLLGKKATIGINELQHKFKTETNIQEAEAEFEAVKPITSTQANFTVAFLDKNVSEEVNVHEREKELQLIDDKQTAIADVYFKGIEPLVTSETMLMTSTSDFKTQELLGTQKAIKSLITSDAKIVSSTIAHDKEKLEEYSFQQPETVVTSLMPNISLSVTEMEISEKENKLQLGRAPNLTQAQNIPAHLLKTPLSQIVNTAEQIDFIETQPILEETANEQRDLQKEIAVLQTTVQEQLQKLNEQQYPYIKANTSFIENESINVTETIINMTEKELENDIKKPSIVAKVDLDASHKIAVVSEVNLRDTFSNLNNLENKYEAAQIASNNFSSIQVSENEAYDNQTPLESKVSPDLKSITPHLILSGETVQVTEILQHEKENQYMKDISPEEMKASPDIISRLVATSSEVQVDTDLAISQPVTRDQGKKANIENIPFQELLISTIVVDENEIAFKETSDVNKVKATFNVDSKQAIIIEETRTDVKPTTMESNSISIQVKAKQSSVVSEAITRQEILVHSTEDVMKDQQPTHKEKPSISFTSFQAIQCDENVSVDKETGFDSLPKPDQRNVDISVISRYGIETTEVLSQSDNLKATEEFSVKSSQIYPIIDEVYGKAANTEEVITNQTAEPFDNDTVTLQKHNVTQVPINTFEQTEIVLAEKESSVFEKIPVTSVGIKNITEMQSVITTCIEAIDKENKLEKSDNIPKQDAFIQFVPYKTIIKTHIIPSNIASSFENKTLDESVATVTHRDELQKSIQEMEVIHGEKEEDLSEFKKELHKASPTMTESVAKLVTEIQTIENENNIKEKLKKNTVTAHLSLSEQTSLTNAEVIVNQDTEDLKLVDALPSKATKSQETQEAILNQGPFIGETEEIFEEEAPTQKRSQRTVKEQTSLNVTEVVISESEKVLDKKTQLKTEKLETSFQSKSYVAITEGISLEKEEDFVPKDNVPDIKFAVPRIDTIDNSIKVNETIATEDEENFTGKNSVKPLPANISVHPIDSINVLLNILAEKEEDLKDDIIPQHVTGEINLITHKHLYSEELQTSEFGTVIENKEPVNKETSDFSMETVKPLQVLEVKAEEHHEDLAVANKTKTFTPSVELEVGEHITITEVHSREKEDSLIMEKSNTYSKGELSFEKNLPLEVHEIFIRDSESIFKQDKEPLKETVNILFDSQRHVTVTDTYVRDKEDTFDIPKKPSISNQNVDVSEISHITTSETIAIEGFEVMDDNLIKNQKANCTEETMKEIVASQPDAFDSLKEFETKYAPEEAKGTQELELQKSYETSENITHEVPEDITNYSLQHKSARNSILEMKSIQQTEIILGEFSKNLDSNNLDKKEEASESHTTLQELTNIQTETLDTIDTLPKSLDVDLTKAIVDLESYRSYIVTDNILVQEESNAITTEITLPKEFTKHVVEIKPVQQTEVVLSESIAPITLSELNEQNIQSTPIKLEPFSQSEIFVQENEIDTKFEALKPRDTANITLSTLEGVEVQVIYQEDSQDIFTPTTGKSVTAEKSLTLHTHLQCSESISEVQTAELKTLTTHTEANTSPTPTVNTPIIVTDSETLQHATNLHLQEHKTKTITKSVTVANEVRITEEFVGEQVSPFSGKPPKFLSAVTTTDEDRKYTALSGDVQFKGELFNYAMLLVTKKTYIPYQN